MNTKSEEKWMSVVSLLDPPPGSLDGDKELTISKS